MMDALWAEAAPIPLHAVAAMLAVLLGGIQLAGKKGGMWHRSLGYLWWG